ncbi:sperm-egg fusion protein LLCFC1 [Sorex araneus]|uniref:sperm-egg fusion protein LLCFC1 n=1 Tax=Sorex araneus TaxID=42254 RepID=UPI00033171A1|nr:sperm-egg fusion protein LLCFC1 [Sorex araneus]
MSPGGQLRRAALLSVVLLLLCVERATPQNEGPDLEERRAEEASSTDQDQAEYREHFYAFSEGEMWHQVGMIQKVSKSASVHTYVFDLAFCFNLASIVVFL